MSENKLKFTLLKEYQVFSEEHKIDVMKKIGPKCEATDFALILGAYTIDIMDVIHGQYTIKNYRITKKRTRPWYLYSEYMGSNVYGVNPNGGLAALFPSVRSHGIRPISQYSNISDISTKVINEGKGVLEVEYGEYPQYAVDRSLSKKLESEFLNGKLQKTGKTYTTDSKKIDETSSPYEPKEHEEYEYAGKHYIRIENINETPCRLSNGKTYNKGDFAWIEVSPIRWIIDEKEKLLVSKNIIASGVRARGKDHRDQFENTEMYMFLNTYFAKDILSLEESKRMGTKKSQFQIEIDEILNKIKKYSIDFQNQELLRSKINSILEEFNNKVDSINESSGISLYSSGSLKSELIIKLNQILNKLKSYNANNEVFYNAINDIEQMIELLKNKDNKKVAESKKNISLVNDIKQIVTICMPYIRKEEADEITGDLLTILEEEKRNLKEYLLNIENFEDEALLTKVKQLEYSSLEGFELLLREKIQPILLKLKDKVDSKEIELEISKKLSGIINDTFETSKDKVVGIYLNEINIMRDNIFNMLIEIPEVSDVYRSKLTEILTKEIDYSKDVSLVLKEMQTMHISIYKLELEIKNKIENKRQIRESKITTRL